MTPEQKLVIRIQAQGVIPTANSLKKMATLVKSIGIEEKRLQKIAKAGLQMNLGPARQSLKKLRGELRLLKREMAGVTGGRQTIAGLQAGAVGQGILAKSRRTEPTISQLQAGAVGKRIIEQQKERIRLGSMMTASIIRQNTGLAGMGKMFNTVGKSMAASSKKMISWGKNTQWLGRQLMFNLSLPIVAAGGAMFKMALDVDKAWVRVKKVYGDTAEEAAKFASVQENILEPAVTSLVRKFGEQRKVIVDLMGDWAAMGFAGEELAEITAETFRVMTLGELEAEDATKTLRTIMATYGLTVKEAAVEMDAFNRIENVTSLQFKDLAQAFPEVVASFQAFNITAREGASLLAGMHERGLDANESAHALKFTLSRLQSPTEKAAALFKKYNFEIFDANGKMKAGIPIIQELAKKINMMTEEEQAVFIATSAGRRQFVRFKQALESTLDPASAFSRAMELSADDTENAAAAQRELNDILESAPVKWKKNVALLQDAGIQLGNLIIPKVIELSERLIILVDKFNGLSDETKNWIINISIVLAALGPLLVVISVISQLSGLLLGALKSTLAAGAWILKHAVILAKWTVSFIKIVAKVTWAAIKIAAQAVIAGAKWIAQAIKVLAKWTWAFIKMVAKALWSSIRFGVHAAKAGLVWTVQAVKTATAWTLAFIKMVAKAFWAGLSQTSPATASGLIWAKNALIASAAWVKQFIIMVAKAVVAGAAMAVQAGIAGLKWVAQGLLAGATWTAQFLIMVAKAVASSLLLVAQALLAGAAWVLQPLLAAAAWVLQLGIIVATSIASAITIAAQAVIAGAAWILQAAKAAAAWILGWIAMLPFNFGVATGMAANAVIAGSAWVAQAGLAAAAWIIAMAPVALAVAAVAVSIAAVVTAYNQVKSISHATSSFNKSTLEGWWSSLTIPEKAISAISYRKRRRELGYAQGGFVNAANGLIAGSSALRDRIPAMLTPGELVLNKDQQKKLLAGGAGGTNITTNVNINVGTMIATPGERREFARTIEQLINENMARLATG